ncbi:DUF3108 domain-containing protein [Chitinophaga pendula]|uniref:DUF3108 domain-containing protein n=1 Tax=Chitinophaga TaxID=79328 RepID=UPI000BAF5D71|nr:MULTISPECIES: DUF3108 domain-containing protein [Chitinophaga]ASZ10879.1 hypothetical protein CK934_07755 [Chitinophaga sp. MD30]UCJ06138.1 DUF3108 domain-containing protein [Chitinophaga pendula]
MRYVLLLLLGLTCIYPARAQQEFCGVTNSSFKTGESITLKVFYNLGRLYVGAGEATFNCSLEKLNGKDVYHVIGDGKTYRTYDWVFKVRDRYESYIDTATMQPLKFVRNVSEGGYKIYNNVVFNQQQNTATSTNGTFKTPDCIQDVISAIYYARNINFDKYKPGDKIPFNMFLDDEVYNIYIRYVGKEEVDTRFGKFKAIKFKPLLIKGTMFQGGEQMTVWVSDDANKVPLRIDSPISVGSIKVDMIDYKNLRYPFTSLLGKR